MQKIISFDKTLEFKTMIGEVTSISLDPSLEFSDDSTVTGELCISGKYKLTAASRLEEDFLFRLPVEIVLSENLEEETRKVSIDDFRYELGDDDTLHCHIDLLIEGVEKIDVVDEVEVTEEEVRHTDVDAVDVDKKEEDDKVDSFVNTNTNANTNINIDIDTNVGGTSVDVVGDHSSVDITSDGGNHNVSEVMKVEKNSTEDASQSVGSLFSSFKDSDETFATYSVYIVRQNDTIEAIMDKYQVSREELESYNDLDNFVIGSKIIIPTHYDEN